MLHLVDTPATFPSAHLILPNADGFAWLGFLNKGYKLQRDTLDTAVPSPD
jgi:hypothetical protein